MIKFKASSNDGRTTVIGIGLSDENIRRLTDGQPMIFSIDEMGFENTEVLILHGETEDKIKAAVLSAPDPKER